MSSSTPLTFDEFYQTLRPCIEQQGCVLSQDKASLLYEYWLLFIKWNRTYNLSAIRDPKEILFKHIVDSLSVEPLFAQHACRRVIDVGTGGGLPGVVLAICHPEREFTLLDSAGKKMRFLFQVCQSLGLSNVNLENRRVEAFEPEVEFDVVISRAFASLQKFTDLTAHLLQPKGQFWAMKGVFPDQELSDMEKSYIVAGYHTLCVPGVEGQRCLIIVNKS